MIKNKLKLIVPILIILLIVVFGVTYAFYEYYRAGANHQLIVGNISLKFNEGTNTINLTNVFPETVEEARREGRTDNILTFTISGLNTTTDENIYYEIMLNNGDDEDGRIRANPEHLVFDLIEIDEKGNENYVVDAMSFSDFNARRIWVNTIDRNTTPNINRTYKLRMWLSEDVFISDTNPKADYSTDIFKKGFASVKVSVYGDFVEKSSPYNYMKRIGVIDMESEDPMTAIAFWSDEIEAVKTNITEVNFVSMKQTEMQSRYTAATIKEDMTDTTKSEAGSVLAWLEPGEVVDVEGTETQQYKMYVASEGTTFFPSDSSAMFAIFMSLTEINFDNVNTRDVTNMMMMFIMCSSLTTLDIDDWDTSNVENMIGTFTSCASLTSLDLSNWDTSNSENMSGMFQGCANLISLHLSKWNTSNVTDMSFAFADCANLTSLDLSNWDTSSVTNMYDMFNGCIGLTTIDLSNWDTSNVTNMGDIFYDCTNLTSINLSGWVMGTLFPQFYNSTNLTTVNLSNVDTSNVKSMNSVFYKCTSLKTIDLSDFDIDSITDMTAMFWGCTNLTTIYANSDWNIGNVNTSSRMFYGCTSLVGAVPFDSTKTDITMANPTTGYFTRKEV